MTNLFKSTSLAFFLLLLISCSTEDPEIVEEVIFTIVLEDGADGLPDLILENIVLTDEDGMAIEQSPLEAGNTYQFLASANNQTTIGVHLLGRAFGNERMNSYLGIQKGSTWVISETHGITSGNGQATVSITNFPKSNNPFYPVANSRSSSVQENFEGFGDRGTTWDSAVFKLRLAQTTDTLIIGNTEDFNAAKYIQINSVMADDHVVLDYNEDFLPYENQILVQNVAGSTSTISVLGFRQGIDFHRNLFILGPGQTTWLGYIPGYDYYSSFVSYLIDGDRKGYLKVGGPVQENEIVVPSTAPQLRDNVYESFSIDAGEFHWGLFRFNGTNSHITVHTPLPMDANQLLISLPEGLADQYSEILNSLTFGGATLYKNETGNANPLTRDFLEVSPAGNAWSTFELN